MAKELPYFKFEPAEWKFGRIQKMNSKVKIAFMDLICKYWHDGCEMTIEDAELDFGKAEIDDLIKFKIVKTDQEFLRIEFLDKQIVDIEKTSKKNSENGKLSAAKKAEKKQRPFNDRSTTVKPNSTDKIRVDKSKEDKIREKEIKEEEIKVKQSDFVASLQPHIEEFGRETLNDFYRYWAEPNKARDKLKFELQKTWDLKMRLTTWKNNESKFNKNGKFTRENKRADIESFRADNLAKLLADSSNPNGPPG